MTIKGSLYVSIPIVRKAFLSRKYLSRQKLAKNFRFGGKWGRNINFCFRDPKWHILARNDVIGRSDRKSRCRGLGGTLSEEPPKNYPSHFMRIFAHLGDKGGNRIVMNFCIRIRVPDVITHANFCDDRCQSVMYCASCDRMPQSQQSSVEL